MKKLITRLLPLVIAVFCALPMGALTAQTDVQFTGGVEYQILGGSAQLTAREISNYSFEDSGTLHLTLWMTKSPDPNTRGYTVARASLGSGLSARSFVSNVSRIADFTAPPDGTYFVHLYVSESPDTDTPSTSLRSRRLKRSAHPHPQPHPEL